MGNHQNERGSCPEHEEIDPIVDRFSENKGLIIDVRNNPGGDSRNTKVVFSRWRILRSRGHTSGYSRSRRRF